VLTPTSNLTLTLGSIPYDLRQPTRLPHEHIPSVLNRRSRLSHKRLPTAAPRSCLPPSFPRGHTGKHVPARRRLSWTPSSHPCRPDRLPSPAASPCPSRSHHLKTPRRPVTLLKLPPSKRKGRVIPLKHPPGLLRARQFHPYCRDMLPRTPHVPPPPQPILHWTAEHPNCQ
jgi:hypothetical protein